MKTNEQIDEALEKLRLNREQCRPTTGFGDDAHGALDAMIKTIEDRWDEDEVYEEYGDEGYITEAAIEMVYWMDSDDEIDDHLYPVAK